MYCSWGYTWHGYYFYHSWLFWFVLSAGLFTAGLYLILRKQQPKKCPTCDSPVENTYLQCPGCGHSLKTHCPDCYRVVDRLWKVCPYCEKALHCEKT
jgi:predicted amidophosphoribosyltransferase